MTDPSAPAPFSFTGTPAEYFRIWVVNVALTVLTLGVYSAWAKVRTEQYFYGHTWVLGNNFAYHGKPEAILKGRLILLGIFLLPVLLLGLGMDLVFVVVAGLLGWFSIFPWLLMRGLKFRAGNSSYRNVRFGFNGTGTEAFRYHVLGFVFAVFTFGLAYPWVAYKQRRWWTRKHRFGTSNFTPQFRGGDYYGIYLGLIGIGVAFGLISAFIGGGIDAPAEGQTASLVALIPEYLWLILVVAFLRARVMNLIYNHSVLGDLKLNSTLKAFDLFLIYLTNIVAVVVSLGLLMPWARVRLARYRADCLGITNAEDLEHIVAALPEGLDAAGEAMTEVFDFDIGI